MAEKAKAVGICGIVLLLSVIHLSGSHLRLVEAVKNRDREAVRSLLEQMADVNAPQADGTTARHPREETPLPSSWWKGERR